jgi:hypothetical protein
LAAAAVSSGCVVAPHDYDRWGSRDATWNRELREDYAALDRARAKLEYDLRRGASSRTIAEDRARIRRIEEEIREDRRQANWYW